MDIFCRDIICRRVIGMPRSLLSNYDDRHFGLDPYRDLRSKNQAGNHNRIFNRDSIADRDAVLRISDGDAVAGNR